MKKLLLILVLVCLFVFISQTLSSSIDEVDELLMDIEPEQKKQQAPVVTAKSQKYSNFKSVEDLLNFRNNLVADDANYGWRLKDPNICKTSPYVSKNKDERDFINWLKQGGIRDADSNMAITSFVNDFYQFETETAFDEATNKTIVLKRSPFELRGVVALKDFKPKDVLLSVPYEFLMTQNSALASEIGLALHERNLTKNFQSDLEYIVMQIMYELNHMDTSPWAPYLRLLPNETYSAAFWNKEKFVNYGLRDIDFKRTDKLRSKVLQRYTDIVYPTLEAYPNLFSPISNYNESHFLISTYLHESRIFGLYGDGNKRVRGMVPLADMLNHKRGYTTWFFDGKDKHFKVVATQHISKCEQIFDWYGNLPNYLTLRNYGFVVRDNTFDSVVLTINPPTRGDLTAENRKTIKQNVGEADVALYRNGFRDLTIKSCRILAMTNQDVENGLYKKADKPINWDNEIAALDYLITLAKKANEELNIKSPLEMEEILLNPMVPEERLVAIYKLGQVEIMKYSLPLLRNLKQLAQQRKEQGVSIQSNPLDYFEAFGLFGLDRLIRNRENTKKNCNQLLNKEDLTEEQSNQVKEVCSFLDNRFAEEISTETRLISNIATRDVVPGLLKVLKNYKEKIPRFDEARDYINPQYDEGSNLFTAIRKRSLDLVVEFLNLGCDPNKVEANGKSAVTEACRSNFPEALELLLKKGGNVDFPEAKGDFNCYDYATKRKFAGLLLVIEGYTSSVSVRLFRLVKFIVPVLIILGLTALVWFSTKVAATSSGIKKKNIAAPADKLKKKK